VWLLDLDAPDVDLREVLSPAERARADAFRHELHRRRFTAGRGRLRELLAAYAGGDPAAVVLAEGPNGKPELAGAELRFNLAHSEGIAVCAVARAEVGVDVEVSRRDRPTQWRQIAERFFAGEEVARLQRLADQAGWLEFLRLWTLKEACLKGTGLGLLTDPRSFSVAPVLAGDAEAVAVGGRLWRCVELRTPDAVAALASAA
jgi:4'-phosphopantetheinyl transferase